MKTKILLGVALSMVLTGCVQPDTGTLGSGQGSATEEYALAVAVAEQRAAYYQQLSLQLQEELLSVRAEYHAAQSEYKAELEALKQQLQEEADGSSAPTVDSEVDPLSVFQFRIEDGKATLIAYTGGEEEVKVPSLAEGCPVTAIADRAFENQAQLQSVAIPDGVLTVGWFAFSGCVGLHSVHLPDSVESISYGAFLNCNSSMIIHCSPSSYAAQYAGSYGIKVQSATSDLGT